MKDKNHTKDDTPIPLVVEIKDSVVYNITKFKRATDAEDFFISLCEEYILDWADKSTDEINSILDDGYVVVDIFSSICIVWI